MTAVILFGVKPPKPCTTPQVYSCTPHFTLSSSTGAALGVLPVRQGQKYRLDCLLCAIFARQRKNRGKGSARGAPSAYDASKSSSPFFFRRKGPPLDILRPVLTEKAPLGLRGLKKLALRPSLICYRHEPDKSDNRIIWPKLIEPVRIELITQPYKRGAPSASDASTSSSPGPAATCFQGSHLTQCIH